MTIQTLLHIYFLFSRFLLFNQNNAICCKYFALLFVFQFHRLFKVFMQTSLSQQILADHPS